MDYNSDYVIRNLTESKDEIPEVTSETGRNLLGLLPMFILIIVVMMRISWTLCRSFVRNKDFVKSMNTEDNDIEDKGSIVRAVWFKMVIIPMIISVVILLCLLWQCYRNNKEIKMNTATVVCAGVFLLMCLYLFWFWCCFGNYVKKRQKTRNPQQRRMYVGSHPRQSLGTPEPTIFVSPSNLPPPPKYECMAPPSYEEVVGVHYPHFSAQPISQPISTALAQGTSTQPTDNVTSITVVNEPRRTSVTVART